MSETPKYSFATAFDIVSNLNILFLNNCRSMMKDKLEKEKKYTLSINWKVDW